MPQQLKNVLEETGLLAASTGSKSALLDQPVLKAGTSGAAVLFAALWEITTSTLFAGIAVAWLIWMLLGLLAAKHAGEPFCANKALGGLWKLAAAVLLLWLFVTVDQVVVEAGGDLWWLPFAGGGWLFGVFVWKAVQKGNQLFPGLEGWARKVLPDSWTGSSAGTKEE